MPINGRELAATINAGVDRQLQCTALDLLLRDEVKVQVIRRDVEWLVRTYDLTDADLDAIAARAATGESTVSIMADYKVRPGCWSTLPYYEPFLAMFDASDGAVDRVAIAPAGTVTDVLAVERDYDEDGARYEYEYVQCLLPRTALPGGLEAVLLPRFEEYGHIKVEAPVPA